MRGAKHPLNDLMIENFHSDEKTNKLNDLTN